MRIEMEDAIELIKEKEAWKNKVLNVCYLFNRYDLLYWPRFLVYLQQNCQN